jgi:hypothetical protein
LLAWLGGSGPPESHFEFVVDLLHDVRQFAGSVECVKPTTACQDADVISHKRHSVSPDLATSHTQGAPNLRCAGKNLRMVKRQYFYLALKLPCLPLLISMEELDLLVWP